jgi:hypothetical protein
MGNARTRNLLFDIKFSMILKLYDQQGGKCAVSGIQFCFDKHGDAVKRPLAPSIDRVDSFQGYTIANIRLVCVAVNLAMNQWGIDLFRRIADGVVKRQEASGA